MSGVAVNIPLPTRPALTPPYVRTGPPHSHRARGDVAGRHNLRRSPGSIWPPSKAASVRGGAERGGPMAGDLGQWSGETDGDTSKAGTQGRIWPSSISHRPWLGGPGGPDGGLGPLDMGTADDTEGRHQGPHDASLIHRRR